MKKVLLYILTFIIIGEIMIRFDKHYTIFEENRVVKMPTNIKITDEYKLLKQNKLPNNNEILKIMVVGDSYIHGGGIEFKDNFSQQLKKLFKDKLQEVLILDISKPSSNSLDNNLTYFKYVNDFNPNIIIWGYNMNDIEGNLQKKNNLDKTNKIKIQGSVDKNFISKVYTTVKKSEFIGYSMSKLHRKLNSYGYLIPGSKFDLNMKSYYENKKNWVQSKNLIKEVLKDIENKSSKLILYKFQDMSINPLLTKKANTTIDSFFNNQNSKNLIYVNGNDYFKEDNYEDYRLSKYDGHPNEKAHKKMAQIIFNIINKQH